MNAENVIEFVTSKFDATEMWHESPTIDGVVEIFFELESFLLDNNISFEFEINPDDFDEDIADDEEIKFELPLLLNDNEIDVVLFFLYHKENGVFKIWVDTDFYVDVHEESDDDEYN